MAERRDELAPRGDRIAPSRRSRAARTRGEVTVDRLGAPDLPLLEERLHAVGHHLLVAFSCKARAVCRAAPEGAWPTSRRTWSTAGYPPYA